MKWFCGVKLLHFCWSLGVLVFCVFKINKYFHLSLKKKANLFTIYELECLRLKEAVTTYKDVLGEITPRCVC